MSLKFYFALFVPENSIFGSKLIKVAKEFYDIVLLDFI